MRIISAARFAWIPLFLGYLGLQWPLQADWIPQQSGWLLDRNDRPLSEILATDSIRAGWVDASRFPESLIGAVLASEDGRFFWHPGVDPIAIGRAALQYFQAGKIVSGGSTITQQLSRLLWPRPRTLLGKTLEAQRAFRLELTLTKREILEQYLNRVPFGNQLYGIQAAARVYLNKSVETLTPAECAFLTALPRAPGWLNPYRRREAIAPRQKQILRRMAEAGYLTEAELQSALRERLALKDTRGLMRAPHFARQALKAVEASGREQDVRTTLDLRLQSAAERILTQNLAALASRGVNNGAIVVLDTKTREVLAWVGSREFNDEEEGGQNDGVLALRQPGSALKPFTYLTGIQGKFTASSLLADLPTSFDTKAGPYTPSNYDNRFHGPVRLRLALASSLNIPAVQVAEEVGPSAVLSTLRNLGFVSLDRSAEYYGLALTLGGGEVRLLELANAYATLTEKGWYRPVRFLRTTAKQGERQAVDRDASAVILDILSDDQARALTFGEGSLLSLPFPVAVKTGTSKNFRDNWCIGATPEVTVAVWVGNFSGEPMAQVSGITGAGPVWREVLQVAMEGRPRLPLVPEGTLHETTICPLSGDRDGTDCPSRVLERFIPGKEPSRTCAFHKLARVNAAADRLANPACPRPGDHQRTFEIYPARFADWAKQVNRPIAPNEYALCPQGQVSTEAQASVVPRATGQLQILSPVPQGLYAFDPGIPAPFQKMRMRVLAPPGRKLEWKLDGQPLASGVDALDWPVQRGRFRLEVVTADDQPALKAVCDFLVK